MLKLKWTTRRGTTGIQVHADPATAATSGGWVGARVWTPVVAFSVSLLARVGRAEALGLLPGRGVHLGPLRLCLSLSPQQRGPRFDLVGRVLADLAEMGPPSDPVAQLRRQMPWLRLAWPPTRDASGAVLVEPARWWPASVTAAVCSVLVRELGRQVAVKPRGGAGVGGP